MKKILTSVLRLGMGEVISRLASFALYAYISRAYGAGLLGVLALSQTIATYVTMGTDQGLRMIGARVVAKNPNAAPHIMRCVLRKRLISCALCVVLGVIYALWGPVPSIARFYILGFVLAVIPYALSLDWLAWGLDHLGWLGTWRGMVGVVFALGAVISIHLTGQTLLPLTIANAMSTVLGATLLWTLWHFTWKPRHVDLRLDDVALEDEIRWGTVLPLGISTILNLMFNNFDTVMLGAMTSVAEVGRYSAAYKILFVVFSGYYLLTQSLYPKLSRARANARLQRLFWNGLLALAIVGVVLSLVIYLWAEPILRIIYGSDLHAVGLLRLLSLAIPMDFCAALMGTVLVSRGYDKPVLWGALAATICDVGANLYLIPHFAAAGAAWATLISYCVLLLVLGTSCRRHPLFAEHELRVEASGALVSSSL